MTETRRRRPAVPRKAKTPTLDVLSADERGGVLTALLLAHPELAAEAEAIAAARLESDDSEAVAEDLSYELRALHLEKLADRAGAHHCGRYIEPHEALTTMDNAGLDLPPEWLAEHCPAWSAYRSRPRPN